MRLQDLNVPTLRRAIGSYLAIAWDGGEGSKIVYPPATRSCMRRIEEATTPDEILGCFTFEGGEGKMRKFTLRLGNRRYPFMKLVFQELLVPDSFYFAVDTHDELDIKDSCDDYDQWLEIKGFNARLKKEIERAWKARKVPTFADLVADVERNAPPIDGVVPDAAAPLILVVDDEVAIARSVEALLLREGYRVRCARSAEEALTMVEEETPDLILSDLEMRGMTGLELAARLRAGDEYKSIPFILTTSATVGSSNFRVIDGFLVKPFEASVLLRFIQQHLRPQRPRGEG
jgi:CheY-like chemotaxis protein